MASPHTAAFNGAAQCLQGQAHLQVHQEKDGATYSGQEEEKGAEQCPGSHEESSSQEGLNPSLSHVCNKAFLELWEKKNTVKCYT